MVAVAFSSHSCCSVVATAFKRSIAAVAGAVPKRGHQRERELGIV